MPKLIDKIIELEKEIELEVKSQGTKSEKNQIIERYRGWEKEIKSLSLLCSDTDLEEAAYSEAEKMLFDLDFSLSDIKYFLEKTGDMINETGLFVSAMTNKVLNSNDELILEIGVKVVSGLGYKHKDGKLIIKTKKSFDIEDLSIVANIGKYMGGGMIEVDGNCYGALGYGMNGGELYVHGRINRLRDNPSSIGELMKGGKIIIKKGLYDDIGKNMRGGKIEIKESTYTFLTFLTKTTPSIGYGMSDGIIQIDCDVNCAKDIGKYMEGGSIFINGKAITFGGYIAESMKGGTIMISEDAEKVHEKVLGGTIYVKGKKFVRRKFPRFW